MTKQQNITLKNHIKSQKRGDNNEAMISRKAGNATTQRLEAATV